MFNCAVCDETFGPRVKPVRVVQQTRPVRYHNVYVVEDELGNREKREVDSVGTEVVKEVLVCAADADKEYGIPQPKPAPAVKPAVRFEEPLVAQLKVKTFALVVHTALDRVKQTNKRAEADSFVAIPLIKKFTDENKEFIF